MRMKIFEKYYKSIKKNRHKFQKYLEELDKEKNINKKLEIAQDAVDFALFKNCGYFSCAKLENFYCNIAENIDINLQAEYKNNSVLHVMTNASTNGGHTRIVEKWIEYAPNTEEHSVILINQTKNEPLNRLKKAVTEKKGKIIKLKNNNLLDKAKELRQKASQYDYIVLHIHMNDPCALIAFGTNKFKRPIIFFNHSDHTFWLGICISDIVADLSKNRTYFTKIIRKAKNNLALCVPYEENINIKNKTDARNKFNLDSNAKIILTAGSSGKYVQLKNYTIIDIFENCLTEHKDTILIAIGPKSKEWKQLKHKYKDRVLLLKKADYETDYFDYLTAADIVIDSFPMSGGTVMIDAINTKTPVLSLENPIGQFDYLVNTDAYCKEKAELKKKLNRILTDESYKLQIIKQLQDGITAECSKEKFIEKLTHIKSLLPSQHLLYKFEDTEASSEYYNLCVLLNFIYSKDYYKAKKRKFIKKILSIFK